MHKNEFLKYLEFQKRYSKNTINSYASDLEQFIEFCINKAYINSPDDIVLDFKIIRKWVVDLSESGNSSITINRKISALKSLYKFLLKEKLVEKNPAEKIIRLKTKHKLPEFLNSEQTKTLFQTEHFQNNFEGIRDKLVLEILYDTGIRRYELINLKHRDIDIVKKTIKVTGKRNKQRIIPFPSGLEKTINEYQEILKDNELKSEYLIVTIKGQKAYPNLIYRIVKKYLNIVSTLSKNSPHILRHTYATHMLNNGADINAVKELLGHSNLSATQIYTHNTFDKLNKIYKLAHPRAQK